MKSFIVAICLLCSATAYSGDACVEEVDSESSDTVSDVSVMPVDPKANYKPIDEKSVFVTNEIEDLGEPAWDDAERYEDR